MKPQKATKSVYPIIRELVNLIPLELVKVSAAEAKVVARKFSPMSHLVALIYQHLSGTE